MPRLSMVIADIDEIYTKGLSGYVNSYHPTAFTVSCFTKADSFAAYLEQKTLIDVLLISPEFYDTATAYNSIKLRAVLSEGSLSQEYPGFQVISKFMTGEKLLGEVLHLYSKLNPKEMRSSTCLKNTRIIAVYSTAGGTGKTTVAAALSIQCNELGMRSFYLNLESLQSTGAFFKTNSKRNLSYVFYYLKEKSNNLSFKLEGVRSSDTDSEVHYFSPPESPLEYEEIDAEELEQLIRGIKEMGCYDYIFIDMSSTFDRKNYKIMNLSDHIVLVSLQETVSLLKNRVLQNELAKLTDTDKESVSDKFITVINKYKDKSSESIESPTFGIAAAVRIPEYTRTLIKGEGEVTIDDDDFRKAVNQLINAISCE